MVTSKETVLSRSSKVEDSVIEIGERKELDSIGELEKGMGGAGSSNIGKSVSGFKCNSLTSNIKFWERIGTPLHLLEVIQHGYRLPFKPEFETPTFCLPNPPSSKEDETFIKMEIEKLLLTGAVSVLSKKPKVVSPLFVVRNTAKPRMIINLSKLNDYIECPKFKYEDLGLVSSIICPKGWLAKFDMKSGYHHVPIHPDFRSYLGFAWPDKTGAIKYYAFNALPFGLNVAPYIFTKIFRPLLALWRSKGIDCALYLDDGLIWARTFEKCEESIAFVRVSLKAAGVYIQEEKSILVPVRAITFLGMIIDLENSRISPTKERLENTAKCLKLLETKTAPTLRERLKFTGQVSSMWVVLGPKASIFTKNLYKTICAYIFYDAKVPLNLEEKEELKIWKNFLTKPIFRSLIPPSKVFSFYTDASNFALGAVTQNGETLSRPLLPEERNESSTYRELLGVVFGLQCFEGNITESEVHVFTDNQNILPIIRKGSMIPKLNSLSIWIVNFLERKNATIIAHWVPREENKLADLASRMPDREDWAIRQGIFEKVMKIMGPAHVDRFASCTNAKLPRFNARVPSPGAEAVDAFTADWSETINYCVPPVDLLYPTVTFVQKGRFATILGLPDWPTHPVYSLLKNKDGSWKSFISKVFRIPKGVCFLVPASQTPCLFDAPFLKTDFLFLRLF